MPPGPCVAVAEACLSRDFTSISLDFSLLVAMTMLQARHC